MAGKYDNYPQPASMRQVAYVWMRHAAGNEPVSVKVCIRFTLTHGPSWNIIHSKTYGFVRFFLALFPIQMALDNIEIRLGPLSPLVRPLVFILRYINTFCWLECEHLGLY